MMDEMHLVVTERGEETQEQKDARKRLRKKLSRGELPRFEDAVAARGLVLKESQDSVFSEAWIPMAIVFLLVGLFAGRSAAILALGASLLLIYGVSTWWKDNALVGVGYQRSFDRTRVFPGEAVRMRIDVVNNKPLPLTWLRFDDHLPLAPKEAGDIAEVIGKTHGEYVLRNVFTMTGSSSLSRTFTFTFPRRGYYTMGPVSYRSGDVFTLFTIEREHDNRDRIVVYPQVWPLDALGLPAKEPFGELNVRRSLFTDPIRTQGIRDYHPHDRFRDIHWKASARRSTLQTKVYDPSTGMTLAVFLNVATMHRHWMGFNPEQLERAICVAASVANYGAEQDWAIGLYVNGAVPGSDQPIRVPPGRSPEQLGHVLEALAATSEFATASIERLMTQESPRLPWAATLALVTAHVGEEMAAVLLRLKEAGRRVALITLAEEAPDGLAGILTYHVPPDAAAFAGEGDGTEADVAAATGERSSTEASLSAVPVPLPVENDRGRSVDDDA